MRRPARNAAFLFSLSFVLPLMFPAFQGTRPAPPDFAHDLGVGVKDVKPIKGALSAAARTKVAAHVDCKPEELAGIQLFTGTIVPRSGPERVEDLVVVPLAGAASGGRLVFSATQGCAREMGLWGALDFDDDPTLRWGVFIEQLRKVGTHETGAGVEPVALAMQPAQEVRAHVAELAAGQDDAAHLGDALLRQRQAMRRNGIWLGMSRRGMQPPPPEWLDELAAEMEAVARLAPVLEPVLGPGSAPRHAGFARDLAAVYTDMAGVLRDDASADLADLQPGMLKLCGSCHESSGPAGKWPEVARKRRSDLDLAGTRLELGFDVAPAPGDHQGVSKELADKVRAGLLVLEATKKK